MQFGNLKQNHINSPLEGLARVRPQYSNKSILQTVAPLMLTSLVDAFAVIVIYLLVSTSQSSHEIEVFRDIKLPRAQSSRAMEPGVSVRVVNNQFFLGSEKVSIKVLSETLKKYSETFESENDLRKGKIIIQADKNSNFESINPLISVASQSGFSQIKFATLEGN